jgi:tRNA threonylcarbamoyladenosine biosynthesis protein TsaE
MTEKREEFISTSIEETGKIAEKVLTSLTAQKTATLITLSGNLGSGKTAFTKECARLLGITDTITSPTFVIMKKYPITHTAAEHEYLIHIDAYRLESGRELTALKFEQILEDPKNLILLEWPKQVADILPPPTIALSFETLHGEADTARKIAITSYI